MQNDFKTQLRVHADLPDGAAQGKKVEGFDRLFKTGRSHEYVIMPKDSKKGVQEDSEDMDEVFQEQEPAPKPRRTRKRQQPRIETQEAVPPPLIPVQVELEGFGAVPTRYTDFDEGEGCLRIGLCSESWIPPRATRNDEGEMTGAFSFVNIPGKRWLNIGLEFASHGKKNIVLVEVQ